MYMYTSNVTSVTEVHSACARLFAGTWRPLVSYYNTIMLRLFVIVEYDIARFLCAMRVFTSRHHPHPL